jgi:hypothetical protein
MYCISTGPAGSGVIGVIGAGLGGGWGEEYGLFASGKDMVAFQTGVCEQEQVR